MSLALSTYSDLIPQFIGDKNDFKTVETLCNLRQVNHKFNEKFGSILKQIIEDSNLINFLNLKSEKEIKNFYKFIKKLYPNLSYLNLKGLDFDKWSKANPDPYFQTISKGTNQKVLKNPSGNHELLSILPLNKLNFLNLETKEENTIQLKKEIDPSSSSMALSDSWIAIASKLANNQSEIAIFNKDNGDCLHVISGLSKILQIEYKDNSLYALNDDDYIQELLRYDCNHWNEPPKKQILPEYFSRFFISSNAILFTKDNKKLLAIPKKDYFSNKINSSYDLTHFSYEFDYISSKIQLNGDDFYALTKSKNVIGQSLQVRRFRMNDIGIDSTVIKTLPLNKYDDFYIHLNKIFIAADQRIECYDLFDSSSKTLYTLPARRKNFNKLIVSDQKILYLQDIIKLIDHQITNQINQWTLDYSKIN